MGRSKNVPVDSVERKLAAILAADVAGYSRLMGQDEAGTLARLKALRRELIDPAVAEHKGRIVTRTRPAVSLLFWPPEQQRDGGSRSRSEEHTSELQSL